MTNDDKMIGTFKSLSAATEAIVKEAFAMRAKWKKKKATEAQLSHGAAVAAPTEGGVGQGKARGE